MSFLARRIGVVLIDLSGTIHIEETAIPGAIEGLKRLRQATDVKLKFVTNTTKESKRTLMNRLAKAGFSIEEKEIFTCLTAARQLIINRNYRPFYLVSEDALEDFEGLPTNDPTAVVVGLAPDAFHYENMTKAFRLLLDGAALIAIHKSRYFKRKDGMALGPGAYVSALEYSSGVKAEVVGKPEGAFFLSALQDLGASPEEAVMIGDDVAGDIEGAMKAGLQGCLVKTGKYRPNDENTVSPPPTVVADDFSKAVDLIIEHNKAF